MGIAQTQPRFYRSSLILLPVVLGSLLSCGSPEKFEILSLEEVYGGNISLKPKEKKNCKQRAKYSTRPRGST